MCRVLNTCVVTENRRNDNRNYYVKISSIKDMNTTREPTNGASVSVNNKQKMQEKRK